MYISYEERVKTFDTDLEFVEALTPFNWGFAFRVRLDGKDYVLKGDDSQLKAHMKAVNAEKSALKRARLIKAVPKLIKDYGLTEAGYAFLKDYVSGTLLYKADWQRTKNKGLIGKLAGTVAKLHLVGVSNLDIEKRNIIISPDYSDARFFDFNTAITNRGYNSIAYGFGVTKDLLDLKRLSL